MRTRYQEFFLVSLVPDILWMDESEDLTLFRMTNWSLERWSWVKNRNIDRPEGGVRVRIVLQRKIMNEVMTTFLPSFLLMIITFATTFFKPFFFEAALSVNLTTMLVMTTIFIGIMDRLPSTAYVKMIDIWLVLCQLVPFLEVVLLTAMEYHRVDNYDETTTQNIIKHDPVVAIKVGEVEIGQEMGSYEEEAVKTAVKTVSKLNWLKNVGKY